MTTAYFQKWYAQNRERLAAKRKQTYRDNPEYRKRALERSSAQRAKARVSRPVGYEISFAQAAIALGVPIAHLREWRRKGYFPEPMHHQQKMYFSSRQVNLVRLLRNFFAKSPRRPKKKFDLWKLQQFVQWIKSNW